MTTIVASLKEGLVKKYESPTVASPVVRTIKLTKPAKVPSWSCDMTLEMYVKEIET